MTIDADHLFRARHSGIWRLAVYVGACPVGLSRRQLVLVLLLRMN